MMRMRWEFAGKSEWIIWKQHGTQHIKVYWPLAAKGFCTISTENSVSMRGHLDNPWHGIKLELTALVILCPKHHPTVWPLGHQTPDISALPYILSCTQKLLGYKKHGRWVMGLVHITAEMVSSATAQRCDIFIRNWNTHLQQQQQQRQKSRQPVAIPWMGTDKCLHQGTIKRISCHSTDEPMQRDCAVHRGGLW